ncbi:MAG: ATP-binding protein [Porcipelethomonas sp.]
MKELKIEATIENLEKVHQFIDEQIEAAGCKMKTQMLIDISVEEIFVNIAHYAYCPDIGSVTIRVEINDVYVTITFIDSGKKYNPLEKPDPDTTVSAEEREIGGLGIYIVKKSMDDMTYEFKDGKNILSIIKKL